MLIMKDTFKPPILYMSTKRWINSNQVFKTSLRRMMMMIKKRNFNGILKNKLKSLLNYSKNYMRTITKEKEENSFLYKMNKVIQIFPLQL